MAFTPGREAEEQRALDLELNVLDSIEDVTDRVNAAVKPEMNSDAAFAARRAIIAQIEKESQDKTGLRSDVVTLYQGGPITFIDSRFTRTFAWSSRRNSRSRFTAAIPIISSIRATISISASFASTKTTSRRRSSTYLKCNQAGAEGGRPRLRLRQPRSDRPRIDGLRSGGSARPFVPGMAGDVLSAGSCR